MKSRFILLFTAAALAILLLAVHCMADDASEHREGSKDAEEGGHKRKRRHGGGHASAAAASGAYAAACGRCHWAYAPQLLPQKSWENTLASLGDHFGAEVQLSAQERQAAAGHLLANAADVSPLKLGRKVAHSLNGMAPDRVVAVPYIQRKHRKLAPEVFARKGVGGLANCVACHPGAASLDFEDDRVSIPAN